MQRQQYSQLAQQHQQRLKQQGASCGLPLPCASPAGFPVAPAVGLAAVPCGFALVPAAALGSAALGGLAGSSMMAVGDFAAVVCMQPLAPAVPSSAIDAYTAAACAAAAAAAAGAAVGGAGAAVSSEGGMLSDATAALQAANPAANAATEQVAAAGGCGSRAVASRKRGRCAEEDHGMQEGAALEDSARQRREGHPQLHQPSAAPASLTLLSPQPTRHRMLAPLLPPPPLPPPPSPTGGPAAGGAGPSHGIASPVVGSLSLLSPPPGLRAALASPLRGLGSPLGAGLHGRGGGPAGIPGAAPWSDLVG